MKVLKISLWKNGIKDVCFGVKLFEIHAYEGFSKLLHKEYIVKKTISKIVPKYFYLVIVFFRVLFLVPWYLVHIQNGI